MGERILCWLGYHRKEYQQCHEIPGHFVYTYDCRCTKCGRRWIRTKPAPFVNPRTGRADDDYDSEGRYRPGWREREAGRDG